MRKTTLVAAAALALALGAAWSLAPEARGQARGAGAGERAAPARADDALVDRGRYLVHEVAMCVQCHTPRDATGELVRSKLLQGAPIPVSAPPYPRMPWAFASAHIAGLPGYTDEEAVRLLTTGVTTRGETPRPPMPPFRMTEEDARAVVAYLRSLP